MRPGRTRKKPKDLSACDREERGRGEGGGKGANLWILCDFFFCNFKGASVKQTSRELQDLLTTYQPGTSQPGTSQPLLCGLYSRGVQAF